MASVELDTVLVTAARDMAAIVSREEVVDMVVIASRDVNKFEALVVVQVTKDMVVVASRESRAIGEEVADMAVIMSKEEVRDMVVIVSREEAQDMAVIASKEEA